MDRERAETYLRLLAESELRRATMLPVGQRAGQRCAPRLALAAQALCTAGAVDAGTAAQVRAELELALTARRLSRPGLPPRTQLDGLTLSRMLDERDTALVAQVQRARIASTAFPASGSDAGHPAAPWRVVGGQTPAGAVDTRQQRPLAHHAHQQAKPVERHQHGHAVAGDRTPAGG
jgi:hypothetical protein